MRTLSKALILLVSLSLPAIAGTDTNSPAIEPAASPGSSTFGSSILMKDRAKDSKTEITATEQATFDNTKNIAEFVGRVIVKDSQFTLTCDRLKVLLKKNRKGMESAEAIGNVVIVQENPGEDGKPVKSIGRAGKALFEPDTGNITLTIWPSIQRGINEQHATEEATVMKLNRDGKSTTTGASGTTIVEERGGK